MRASGDPADRWITKGQRSSQLAGGDFKKGPYRLRSPTWDLCSEEIRTSEPLVEG